MNKVLMLSCITAYSFLCAMEPDSSQSPSRKSSLHTLDSLRQKSSPRSLTTVQPDSVISTRSRMPSDPVLRVKSQSRDSKMFLEEENIGQKSKDAMISRKRGVSDGK